MSVDSRVAVAVERLDGYSSIASSARRALLALDSSDSEPLERLAELLTPQERESASLDAIVFQVFVRTRIGLDETEIARLRGDLLRHSMPSASVDALRRIADTLDQERSTLIGRYTEV